MTGWDWSRILSLLEQVDADIKHMRHIHERGQLEGLKDSDLLGKTFNAERALKAIKALLKRERSSKA